MTIEKLTRDNFALSSLDGFVRTQPVTEVSRSRRRSKPSRSIFSWSATWNKID